MTRALAITALLVGTTGAARADVVLEQYVGSRPVYADLVTNLIRSILTRDLPGNEVIPDQVAATFHHLPQPGIVDTTLTARKLFDDLEIGVRDALGGSDFKAAAAALATALDTAFANDGVYILESNARTEITRAQVQLGISRTRLGDRNGALEVFADLARSSNGQPLHGYGPEAERQYNEATGSLVRLPRGKLLISVSEPDAQIFVDEAGSGRGGTFTADVIPGKYRVTVLVGKQSLHYDIAVESGHETTVEIDWELETHLSVSQKWVGLTLTAPADADHLVRYARALARLTGRDQVSLYGISESCDHVVVTGARLDLAGGEQHRVARVVLDNNHDRDLLSVLARYLVQGTTAPEVVPPSVPDRCTAHPTTAAAPARHGRHLWVGYVAGVVGLAAIGGGAYLVSIDGTGTCGAVPLSACPRIYSTAALGWATVGGGVAALGFGTFWFITHHKARVDVSFAPIARGAVAGIAGTF